MVPDCRVSLLGTTIIISESRCVISAPNVKVETREEDSIVSVLLHRSALFEVKNIGDFASAEVVQARELLCSLCPKLLETIRCPVLVGLCRRQFRSRTNYDYSSGLLVSYFSATIAQNPIAITFTSLYTSTFIASNVGPYRKKRPCTQIVHILASKYLHRDYLNSKVPTI